MEMRNGVVTSGAVGDHAVLADLMEEVEENATGRGEHLAGDESSDDPEGVPVVDLTEPSSRDDEAVR